MGDPIRHAKTSNDSVNMLPHHLRNEQGISSEPTTSVHAQAATHESQPFPTSTYMTQSPPTSNPAPQLTLRTASDESLLPEAEPTTDTSTPTLTNDHLTRLARLPRPSLPQTRRRTAAATAARRAKKRTTPPLPPSTPSNLPASAIIPPPGGDAGSTARRYLNARVVPFALEGMRILATRAEAGGEEERPLEFLSRYFAAVSRVLEEERPHEAEGEVGSNAGFDEEMGEVGEWVMGVRERKVQVDREDGAASTSPGGDADVQGKGAKGMRLVLRMGGAAKRKREDVESDDEIMAGA